MRNQSLVSCLVVMSFGLGAIAQDDFGDGQFGGVDFGEAGQFDGESLSDIDITQELAFLRQPRMDGKRELPPPPENPVVSSGDDADSELEKRLAATAEFDLDGVSIAELAEWLRDELETNVLVSEAAFAEEGIDPKLQKVTLVANKISYSAGLRRILSPLGAVAIQNRGVLTLTSKSIAEETLITRVYPVADLALSPISPQLSNHHAVSGIVTNTVAPETWDDVGGPGTIQHFKSTLTISNTKDVHGKIAGLFSALRGFPADRKDALPSVDVGSGGERVTIREAMRSLVDTDLEEASLSDGASSVLDSVDVPYFFHHSLDDESISPDQDTVSAKFKDLPLGQTLSIMLEPLGLDWTVSNESVAIMSQSQADEEYQTRVFDVSELVDDRLTDPIWTDSDATRLIHVITSVTAPNSWESVGGPGSVVFLANRCVLVASNTRKALDEVELQLKMMTRAREVGKHEPLEYSPSDVVQWTYSLTDEFKKPEQSEKGLRSIRDIMLGTDNAIEGPYKMSVIGQKLIVSHRRDVQRVLASLLNKLGVIYAVHRESSGGHPLGFGTGPLPGSSTTSE